MQQITLKIDGKSHQIKVPDATAPYIQVIGVELAVQFFESFAGALIDLSGDDLDSGDVAAIIGVDKAKELGRLFGYKRNLRVPMGREFLTAYRYAKVAAEEDKTDRSTTFDWPDKFGNLHPYVMTEDVAPYVEALGCERAVALLLNFGGSPIYIALQDSGSNNISTVMTMHDIRRLVDAFGKGQIKRVPLGNDLLIKFFAYKNWSRLDIARNVRVSDETVRRTLYAPLARKAFLEQGWSNALRGLKRKAGEAV